MYTTLIFDLDDTLTDDFENCKEAFKIMISSRNEVYSEEEFLKFRKIDKKTWEDRAPLWECTWESPACFFLPELFSLTCLRKYVKMILKTK